MLTYQDYLNFKPHTDDGGSGAVDEATWNRMSMQERFNNVQGGVLLGRNDSRYADLAHQLGITNGSNIMLGGGPMAHAGDPRWYVNPHAVVTGDGWHATGQENQTPHAQQQANASGLSGNQWAAIAASIATMGAASAFTGAGTVADGAFAGGTLEGSTGLDAFAGGGLEGGLGSDAFAGASGTAEGGNSFLSQLNTGRQYFNNARSAYNLVNGGGTQGRRSGMPNAFDGSTGDGSTGFDPTAFLGSLFSGNGSGIGSFLNLLGLGHNAFGNGIGTSQGAIDAGNRAAGLADPWGSSGQRGRFSDQMTPEYVQRMLSQDPSAVLNNPAYKFDLAQGTNAINVGDAAQGTLRSGNRGYELQAYGQGLASKYGQQFINNNMNALGVMGNLAGVNAGSPVGAAQAITNSWDNASNIRNASLNGLNRGGSSNPLLNGGGILGLLGQGGSAIWRALTGGSGGLPGMSNFDSGTFGTYEPYVPPTNTDWNLSDYGDFPDSGGFADLSGAFF